MPISPVARALLTALALFCAALPARAQEADDRAAFEAAMQAYERNHWPQAYAALAQLADRGHPEAARIALQMWSHGPKLYGTAFTATSRQVAFWTQRWGCDGDATSRACTLAAALSP
jgi:hypothetical protein